MRQFSFDQPVECGTSEDCLYLNVWAPAERADEPLPVILWVFGGGHRLGSGSHPCSQGDRLARHGAVVVAANYRLGALGYFAHPALRAEEGSSGAYAGHDLLAALGWNRDNIAAFGGDPGNVTLFGQSAGAAHVTALLSSPRTRGLVHRAIATSGSRMRGGPLGHIRSGAETEAICAALPAAESLGTTEALRAQTPDAFQAPPGTWNISVDGDILVEPIQDVFDRGKQLAVPLMVGYTKDEASPYPQPHLQTREGLLALAETLGSDGPEMLSLYDATSDETALAASYRLRRDIAHGYQSWKLASVHSDSGAAVYMFNLLRAPPLPADLTFQQPVPPGGYGAYHGADIWFAFDNLDRFDIPWEQADREIADILSRAIVRFAATGNPNGSDLPDWPRFDRASYQALLLDRSLVAGQVFNLQGVAFWDRVFHKQED